jgi:hypothetical protein
MSRRILSCAVLLCLLTALTTPTANVAALSGGPQSAQGQAKTQAERAAKGEQKGTTLDETGRVIKTTVPTSENEKVTVSLRYDERSRIRAVVLDDGTQIGLVYDGSGLWQGFSFQDGGKLLFKRDASGKIIGAVRVAKSASQQTPGAKRAGVRRVRFGAVLVDGCREAVAAATAAAVSAVAACLEGASTQCIAASAAAAVAAYRAYTACRDEDAMAEESAA